MATKDKALTERQREIKALLDKGNTPEQAAKRLKISTNAIYQQVRRMRAQGVDISLPGNAGGSTAKPKAPSAPKSRRQSGGQRRAARPAAAPKPQTAEELLRAEIATLDEGIAERTTSIAEAEALIALTREEIAKLESERDRRGDVLAVLTGEKVAHAKPTPRASTNGDGSKPVQRRSTGKAATDKPEAAPAAQEPLEAPQAAQEPTTQAEREATADFDLDTGPADAAAADAAAEAPQEPVPA